MQFVIRSTHKGEPHATHTVERPADAADAFLMEVAEAAEAQTLQYTGAGRDYLGRASRLAHGILAGDLVGASLEIGGFDVSFATLGVSVH